MDHDFLTYQNYIILESVANVLFLGCDDIWCPSETQIGTKWFPWTIGNIDWGGSVGSEKSVKNAQTLFILFVIQGTV